MPTRRQFLAHSATLAAAAALAPYSALAADDNKMPAVRAITRGPRHHWFGYYDKLQFDPTSRYVLGMEVDFEHRSPKPNDEIRLGVIDLENGDKWREVGTSRAWCWQQGCMLQWLPGSRSEVIYNDRDGDHFVSRILDVNTGKRRTVPMPIYAVSPDSKTAVTCDFSRLHHLRPGYGYAGVPDEYQDEAVPSATGIWSVDLTSGESKMLFSLAEIATLEKVTDDMRGAKQWFNHLLFSPSGKRFVFLHRWRPIGSQGNFKTRMITCNADGTDRYVLDPDGFTSHFIWPDDDHILAWTKPANREHGFYLFKDKTRDVEHIGKGVMTENGHCTYLPGNKWILNDTYPDKGRLQHVYLYEVAIKRRVPLGDFPSSNEYKNEWRCDTHPRFSPSGKLVCIDTPTADAGRQLHLIDISGIVG